MATNMDAPPPPPQSPPPLPVLYRNVTALSRERHQGWYIDGDQGYSFAQATNSIYLAAGEFAQAAREYAIVFARDGSGAVIPAILLGLASDQNLMIDADGRWLARYVPAYVRRYPFMLATTDAASNQFTVCIDETYSGFNTAREGELMIGDDGVQCPLLAKSVEFLQEFHQHSELTVKFCDVLAKSALLDSFQANVSLNSGPSFALTGLFCVTQARLQQLPAEQLKQFLDLGYLDLIYLHMHSLTNMERLIELAQPAPDKPPRARKRAAAKD